MHGGGADWNAFKMASLNDHRGHLDFDDPESFAASDRLRKVSLIIAGPLEQHHFCSSRTGFFDLLRNDSVGIGILSDRTLDGDFRDRRQDLRIVDYVCSRTECIVGRTKAAISPGCDTRNDVQGIHILRDGHFFDQGIHTDQIAESISRRYPSRGIAAKHVEVFRVASDRELPDRNMIGPGPGGSQHEPRRGIAGHIALNHEGSDILRNTDCTAVDQSVSVVRSADPVSADRHLGYAIRRDESSLHRARGRGAARRRIRVSTLEIAMNGEVSDRAIDLEAAGCRTRTTSQITIDGCFGKFAGEVDQATGFPGSTFEIATLSGALGSDR